MSSQPNLEHFALELAKKFMINPSDVLKFTNEYWGTDFKQLSLEQMFSKISSSKVNSRASSVASTPRLGATGPSISSLANAMEQFENFELESTLRKKAKTVRPSGPRNNKCMYKFKVGKRTGEECKVACVGEFCAKHTPEDTQMKTTDDEEERFKPADQFTNNKFEVPAPIDPVTKRKISKKTASMPPTNIQSFIQDRVASFKVERLSSGLLVNAATRFVYDEKQDLIYGKLDHEDKVQDLTIHDIEYCKSIRINYQLPVTLGEIEQMPELQVEDPNDDYEELSDGE